jgi:CBS domain-containing protein
MADTVADMMRRDVVTITPDATLRELIRVMSEEGVGGMPVLGEDGSVVGTVSSTDLLWLAASGEMHGGRSFLDTRKLDQLTVRDIMTPDVLSVPPDASMSDLRRFFARTGVHRALVLDDDRIVGIVTLSDVLRTLV